MPSIGSRLLEERERLGLSQPDLAAACRVTMRSQRNYEKDERFPDAAYLAAVAAAGADVRYIVTGDREGPAPLALSPDEHVLLDGYRSLDKKTQKRVLAFILSGETSSETSSENGTKSQPGSNAGGTVHSHVKQQINAPVKGGVAGRDLVHKGRKKKNEAGDQQ